jgi:hypothetical protein
MARGALGGHAQWEVHPLTFDLLLHALGVAVVPVPFHLPDLLATMRALAVPSQRSIKPVPTAQNC